MVNNKNANPQPPMPERVRVKATASTRHCSQKLVQRQDDLRDRESRGD